MSDAISRLREIMHRLRSPGGCPWDQEQTHQSLIPHLIEEAYETAAAIRCGDAGHLEDELGDLLLQVVFHAELGSETGAFDFDTICEAISEKLIRRHPHVFADSRVNTSEGVLRQWEEIKAGEKVPRDAETTGYLEATGEGFPALLRARKLQKKAATAGFDWQTPEPVLGKVLEELDEVCRELDTGNRPALEEELGDLLFAVVNLARVHGFDAETLLAATNDKFVRRFHAVERALRHEGKTLQQASLAEMDAKWENTKHDSA